MRHRLKPPTSTARRRGKRTRAALAEEDEVVTVQPAMTSDWPAACEGVLIPELDELLTEEEEGAAGWWKEEERPEDTSLTDLLQQLAASEDDEARPSSTEAALFTMAASSDAARPHPTKMAAGHSNKNALAARLNRQRKKEYVTGLEGRVARLTGDNLRLERERRALGTRVRELEAESRYLRAVLANDSALCQLLGRLTGLGGVRLATSLFRDPQKKPGDHDYALPGLVIKEEEDEEEAAAAPPIGGGVCLHVDREKVSVEFCPACARSAASSVKM